MLLGVAVWCWVFSNCIAVCVAERVAVCVAAFVAVLMGGTVCCGECAQYLQRLLPAPVVCNTLQHTATHCNTHVACNINCNTDIQQHAMPHMLTASYYTATHTLPATRRHPHCNTLQHTATHCNPHIACKRTHPHCNTLQHTATHCNTLQHTATHCTPHIACNTQTST